MKGKHTNCRAGPGDLSASCVGNVIKKVIQGQKLMNIRFKDTARTKKTNCHPQGFTLWFFPADMSLDETASNNQSQLF